MKRVKTILVRTFAIAVFALIIYAGSGFKMSVYDVKPSTGEVNQIEGLYVFTDSKPVMPYDVLSNEGTFTLTGSYNSIVNALAKKAHKNYPSANAIIFNGGNKCEIIKFK